MIERANSRVWLSSPRTVLLILDADGTILLANPAMSRMLGTDADTTMAGAAMQAFITPTSSSRSPAT